MAFSPGKLLTKIFGSRNERLLKRFRRIVDEVNALEPQVRAMTDEQLRARTAELRAGLAAKPGRPATLRIDDVMPEAFAMIRESMDRHIGIREIFNPEQKFDPDRLDDKNLELYDSVQRAMIATGESWQRVAIPHGLYEAVRALHPESRPPFRARPFDVQIIGGLVLSEGKIAEMATGEGKTFVAPLACFLRVLQGMHCHVVTVNDYLVRRDASWVRPAFENLGMTVGYIQSDMDPGSESRRKQYGCDITYGTNSEFGFDFLRDNMKERVDLQVQGPLDYAIVDEVDSILIDEARTPLIISGAAHDDAPKYRRADEVARKVMELNRPWDQVQKAVDAAKRAIKAAEGDEDKAKDKAEKEKARQRKAAAEKQLEEAEKRKEGLTQYYEVELDRKSVHLTHEGIAAAQDAAGVGSFYVGNNMEWPHLMEQSMRAHVVYERDKDYVVERGKRTGDMEVIIVDEYTGRKMEGRQWSDGLHQAIEAKERVPIKQETQTLATITLQNFFKLYKALSGMTGTAQTEAEEFMKIYRLEVVTIPTNRPVVRQDNEDRIYRTEPEKWDAIIEEIKEASDAGRPVLVGTTSVEKSEMLSAKLTQKYGVGHEVLNAKHHEREAQIVAVAGQQHKNVHGETVGNVTIATNMAGRGTDIKLAPESHKAGGLHVIGTERHTARRIDNQLRGRGGRQGDPGSSRFYVSLQDDLMAMFAGEWTIKVLGFLGMEEGEHIEDKRITKGILRAQKKVEERNFLQRKNLLEYDEVMDHQRTSFYGMRQRVLEGREVDTVIWEMIGDAITDAVDKYVTQDYVAANVAEWARVNFGVTIEPDELRGLRTVADLEEYIKAQARVDIEDKIGRQLSEFMGEDVTDDPREWDTKGLSSWAMSQFGVNLSQAQIKRMTAKDVEEQLREAAHDQLAKRDAAGLAKYLEPLFAERELAAWAKEKFAVEVSPKEMVVASARDDNQRKPAEEIVELIETRAREAYARREVEYPVDHVLTFVTGGNEADRIENPYAADYVRQWAKAKYGVELGEADVRGQSTRRLRDQLIGMQEQFLRDGKIEAEVDALIRDSKQPGELAQALRKRFGVTVTTDEIEAGVVQNVGASPREAGGLARRSPASADDDTNGDGVALRDELVRRAKQFLRQELTDLEQFVLIQIFDQSWKDHLYAMDMLKAGIGLVGFAEKDPRVMYKKEGYRYFEEMMAGIRDKVTDLIFRARVVGQAQAKSAYRETAAVHQDTGGYGVGENVRQTAAADPAAATAGGDGAAGSGDRDQGGGGAATAEAMKVKTIVRDAPKVGRNDLCPCGSGKKYKKCHGVDAA
jgi:preprotein translocase subunit SecA